MSDRRWEPQRNGNRYTERNNWEAQYGQKSHNTNGALWRKANYYVPNADMSNPA